MMTTKGYVIAWDTYCDGWQCERHNAEGDEDGTLDEKGAPVIYATEAEAKREIAKNRMDIPDLEEFVVPVEEYLEGRRTIWIGESI